METNNSTTLVSYPFDRDKGKKLTVFFKANYAKLRKTTAAWWAGFFSASL